jgi:Icc-related predicted phosphoesterase
VHRSRVSLRIQSRMRMLVVSDLHYSLPQLDWVVDASSSFDATVLVGDSLNIRSPVPLDAQSVVISRYLSLIASETNLAVSSGNHDLIGPDEQGEQSALWLSDARAKGIATDGDSLLIEDTMITICPWWDGPLGRTRVQSQIAGDAKCRPETWIWLYHWPPLGSPTCWTGRKDYGDGDVRVWIEDFQPDFVLTGHVHESPFKVDGSWADRIGKTWVFNAGHQIGRVPAYIDLDLTAHRAQWVSIMGSESIDLRDLTAPARTLF